MRTVAGVAVGVLVWVLCTALAGAASHVLWPAYAAAEPTRGYTLAMLLARLITGAIALLSSARLSAAIAGRPTAGLWVGAALLLVSTPYHISIWPHYPAWYHLTYLGYLLPLGALGARIGAERSSARAPSASMGEHVHRPIER